MENKNEKNVADVAKNVRRTVSGILWNKFLDTMEKSSWMSIFSTVLKVLFSLVLAASLFDIRAALDLFSMAAKWADFAIPKTLAAFLLVFGWRVWYFCGKWIAGEIKGAVDRAVESLTPEAPEVPTWYGVPVVEIVDYIFENRSFRRDDVEARFAIPRNRFDEMAKKMDEVRIFVRGENNSRVLNPDFSRSDVSSMLLGAAKTGELHRLFRKDGPSSWTSSPSMPEIVERDSEEVESPSPRSGFVVRRLESVSAS